MLGSHDSKLMNQMHDSNYKLMTQTQDSKSKLETQTHDSRRNMFYQHQSNQKKGTNKAWMVSAQRHSCRIESCAQAAGNGGIRTTCLVSLLDRTYDPRGLSWTTRYVCRRGHAQRHSRRILFGQWQIRQLVWCIFLYC